MKIIGVSASAADSAACVLEDGIIRGAAQEERFTRRLHDGGFPAAAIAYCLERSGVESTAEVDIVAFAGDAELAEWERRVRTFLPDFRGAVYGVSPEASLEGRSMLPTSLRKAAELAGAGGTALGAAIASWQSTGGGHYDASLQPDDVGLGPAYTSDEIREFLERFDLPYELIAAEPAQRVAELLAEGQVVGVLQGGMEFGPRASGHRSLFADARSPRSVARLGAITGDGASASEGILHAPLRAFDEPLVCSPIDAYRCLLRTDVDCLMMEDVLVWRR